MPKPNFVHAVVANRDRKGDPIELEVYRNTLSVAPRTSTTVIMTWPQFEKLRDQQRDAVRRKPGILRLVDFWVDAAGERVEVKTILAREGKEEVKVTS